MTFCFFIADQPLFAQEKEEGNLADFEKKVDNDDIDQLINDLTQTKKILNS